jgi:NAD-dependent dihydropyrimidine dehydrogenase PreA subunit
MVVEAISDLCGLAANHDPRLQEWAQNPSLTVIACFPRAVRWLFHAAGVPLSQERTRFFNMRTQSAAEILNALSVTDEQSAPSISNHQSSIINQRSDWVPWFPVIDYDRCVNCKQCLNFCLFGVYGLSDEGRVEVQKPSGCKTNCPACARMCPRQAIIFPKYADPPINGDAVGAGPDNEPSTAAAPTGDLYERIRNRSAGGKRFSTQTGDPSPNRSCPTLDSLKRELNIPDDVLASLSPEEMKRIMSKSRPESDADAGKKDNKHHG